MTDWESPPPQMLVAGWESPRAALKFLEQLGLNLVIVVHICHASTWVREVCGSEVEGYPQP